jgi:hypothetical protein
MADDRNKYEIAKFGENRAAAWAFMYQADARGWSPGFPSYDDGQYTVTYSKLSPAELLAVAEVES